MTGDCWLTDRLIALRVHEWQGVELHMIGSDGWLLSLPVPPRVGELPQKTVVEGRTVVLPCEATGFPAPNITWKMTQWSLQLYNNADQIQVQVTCLDDFHLLTSWSLFDLIRFVKISQLCLRLGWNLLVV